jgi:hypothetical protein
MSDEVFKKAYRGCYSLLEFLFRLRRNIAEIKSATSNAKPMITPTTRPMSGDSSGLAGEFKWSI